jgi:hypothetical protein
MTSTLEGLQALASKEGYLHHGYLELHDSATRGCPLCGLLRGAAFNKFSAATKSKKIIRVFAKPTYSNTNPEHSLFCLRNLTFTAGSKYEFGLRAFCPGGSLTPDFHYSLCIRR